MAEELGDSGNQWLNILASNSDQRWPEIVFSSWFHDIVTLLYFIHHIQTLVLNGRDESAILCLNCLQNIKTKTHTHPSTQTHSDELHKWCRSPPLASCRFRRGSEQRKLPQMEAVLEMFLLELREFIHCPKSRSHHYHWIIIESSNILLISSVRLLSCAWQLLHGARIHHKQSQASNRFTQTPRGKGWYVVSFCTFWHFLTFFDI